MMGAERRGQEQMIRKMKQFEIVIYDVTDKMLRPLMCRQVWLLTVGN